ncbi:unnamed protein product, partial [Medioppia subpectinata]
ISNEQSNTALVGDVSLVWPQNDYCLTIGILAFSVTHMCYVNAVGIFSIIVVIYSLLIMIMLWRSLALYKHRPSNSSWWSLTG